MRIDKKFNKAIDDILFEIKETEDSVYMSTAAIAISKGRHVMVVFIISKDKSKVVVAQALLPKTKTAKVKYHIALSADTEKEYTVNAGFKHVLFCLSVITNWDKLAKLTDSDKRIIKDLEDQFRMHLMDRILSEVSIDAIFPNEQDNKE